MSTEVSWVTTAVAVASFAVFGVGLNLAKDAMVKVGWYYPIFWAFGLFVAQSTLLPISWWSDGAKKKDIDEEDPTSGSSSGAPLWFYMVDASLGWGSQICMNIANGALPGSILQMMKALKLIVVVGLSVVFLGTRLQLHQKVGVGLNVAGVVLITIATLQGVGWASTSFAWLGLLLGAAASMFQAAQATWEQDAMKRYDISPCRLAGAVGVVGTGFGVVALVVANLAGWEDSLTAVQRLGKSELYVAVFLMFLLGIPPDKLAARAVTAYASAIARTLVELGRTFALWGIEIALNWDRFNWTELCGYLVIAYGTLIYSKMLNLPLTGNSETTPLMSKPKPEPIKVST
jgi:drug/metabolite transporter (DMT)-like permease